MDRRLKLLAWLAALGCVAGGFAAVGGSGTLVGGVLCVVTLLLFCLLYQMGSLGPHLPPARIPRKAVVAAVWGLAAILLTLALLIAVRVVQTVIHQQT